MTEDVLFARARGYLRERVFEALKHAEGDLAHMLQITKAAGTDSTYDCQRYAVALLYDVVTERGRPLQTQSGSISCSACPSFDEVARNIASNAAKAAIAAIGSSEGKSEKQT